MNRVWNLLIDSYNQYRSKILSPFILLILLKLAHPLHRLSRHRPFECLLKLLATLTARHFVCRLFLMQEPTVPEKFQTEQMSPA